MSGAELAIDGGVASIAGVLDFVSVPVIDDKGLQWLADSAPAQCQLDLTAVTYSSSIGIALLLGWLRVAQKAGKVLTVKNMPVDMLALASVSGVDTLLSAP